MKRKISKIRTDIELCILIRQNNKEAFDYLYHTYSSMLYGLAINVVGSEDEAAVIVEHTFVSVWKNIDQFQIQKFPFKIWLIRLMILESKNYVEANDKRDLLDIAFICHPALPQVTDFTFTDRVLSLLRKMVTIATSFNVSKIIN